MRTAWSNMQNHPLKRRLFRITVLLLLIGAFGYIYWTAPDSKAEEATASSDKLYYAKLIYAVNEMNHQVDKYTTLRQQNQLAAEDLQEDEAYVTSLLEPLNAPPEELSVAQYITEEMYDAYHAHLHNLESDSAEASATLQQSKHNYDLFIENANLITYLSTYSGLNVYCH
ncbi:hypothetical protein [Paenibacillus sp. HB172176]|uniref:hypothetical protein n=1 Tax=Paenibacillus sp. HB172176 TaxID=2493690 RepID=UPI00143B42FC|nr:hypothetical protein [Paenibacillus sp. HB172176]